MLKPLGCLLSLGFLSFSSAQAQSPQPWGEQQTIYNRLKLNVTPEPAPPQSTSDGARLTAVANQARTNPRAYAEQLMLQRSWFKGNLMHNPAKSTPIVVFEGVSALNETIDALLALKTPLKPLRHVPALDEVAAKHARELVRRRELAHDGEDGSTIRTRLQRAGEVAGLMGENIALGDSDPASIINQLLIDDGVPSRGHRDNLLDPRFQVSGGACAVFGSTPSDKNPQSLCVMVYATSFTPHN